MANQHDRDFYYADEPDVSWPMHDIIEDWAVDTICSMPERIYDADHDYCSFSWGIGR